MAARICYRPSQFQPSIRSFVPHFSSRSFSIFQKHTTPPSSHKIHRFPSKDYLIQYLESHPSTNDAYLKKHVIEKTADVFANKDRSHDGINMSLKLMLEDLNKEWELSSDTLSTVKNNLTKALVDCSAQEEVVALPSKDKIAKYFAAHPLTGDSIFEDRRILLEIAAKFENHRACFNGLHVFLGIFLRDLQRDENYRVADYTLNTTAYQMAKALAHLSKIEHDHRDEFMSGKY
jgi:hypothetical protein